MSMLLLVFSALATEVTWSGGGHAANPQWSSDGSWLAFEVNNNSDKVDLYLVRLNGGNPSGPATRVVIPGGGSSFSTAGAYTANPIWANGNNLFF